MNKIIPLRPNRVWRTYTGGKILDRIAHNVNAQDSHFPEDWIASVTPATNPGREHLVKEGLSQVTIGDEELTLKQLLQQHPVELLGRDHYQHYGAHTAFLLKFLDSAVRLHFQCHPTIVFAKQHLNSDHGKTEGYYILDIRDDVAEPYIYLGFQYPPTLDELKDTIIRQDIPLLESYFQKIPIKKGDAFYVPGGLPHAIGEGVFMIEIMEPTDLVARIEFEKSGYVLPEKARFMDKGIDFGLSMFNLAPISTDTIKSNYFINPRPLIETPEAKEYVIFDDSVTNCFRLNKLQVKGQHSLHKQGFFILIVTGGGGTIGIDEEVLTVSYGEKFFIPASAGDIKINSLEGIEIVVAMPPSPFIL